MSRFVELTIFFEGGRILPEPETKRMEAETGRRSRRSGTRKSAGQCVKEVVGDGPGDLRRRSRTSRPRPRLLC
jgi:hypothetical protein